MSTVQKPALPANPPLFMVLDPLQCGDCGAQYARLSYTNKDLHIVISGAMAVLPNASGIDCVHCGAGRTIDEEFHDQYHHLVDGLMEFLKESDEVGQMILL